MAVDLRTSNRIDATKVDGASSATSTSGFALSRDGAAALSFATVAHASQKYSGGPYSVHLREVQQAAKQLGFTSSRHEVVAALHDVLEDTSFSRDDLAAKFGAAVADDVVALSRSGMSHADYFAAMGPLAFEVKLADRLCNISRIDNRISASDAKWYLDKYKDEQPALAAECKKRGLNAQLAVINAAFDKAREHVMTVTSKPLTLSPTQTSLLGRGDINTVAQQIHTQRKEVGGADGLAQIVKQLEVLARQFTKNEAGAGAAKKSGVSESGIGNKSVAHDARSVSTSPMAAVRFGNIGAAKEAKTKEAVEGYAAQVDGLYKAADWKGLAAFLDDNHDGLASTMKDAAKFPGVADRARVTYEKILVGLNKSKQFTRTLDEASTILKLIAPEGVSAQKLEGLKGLDANNRKELAEIFGAVGKAFRELSNKGESQALSADEVRLLERHSGKNMGEASGGEQRRVAQQLSTSFYEAAFFSNRSFYGAVNAAHGNMRLGNMARAERFAWMADASMKDGGHGSADYWGAATKLEVALLTKDNAKLPELFKAAASLVEQPWEAETTARTLGDTARIYKRDAEGGSNETAKIDQVVDKMNELVKNPALAKDQAWMDAAVKELGGGAGAGAAKGQQAGTLPEKYSSISRGIFQATVDTDWRHQSIDLDTLYKQAGTAKEKLDAVVNGLANEMGGEAKLAGLKGRERAEQKIGDFAGDASQLVDIARASLQVNSVDDLYAALSKLSKQVEIVGIKDRFDNPYASGYRDVLLKVRFPEAGGHVAELQLHLKGVLDVKNGPGHVLYEEQRNFWTKAAKEGRSLTPEEKTSVAALDAKMKSLYDGAYLAGLK